jgi:D-alanine-D-alanine ligase
MYQPRITVLRGGPSLEHEVSLQTGATVIRSLLTQNYEVKDILITKGGEWLDLGRKREPDQILKMTDVVFIALHGAYGEDGAVQRVIQRESVPFTGSNALSSAIAFNKYLTKQVLSSHGILLPKDYLVTNSLTEDIDVTVSNITTTFGPEYIIKPVASGSSFGVELVREGQSLKPVLERMLTEFDQVLVEQFIRGKEATSAVLEDFRDDELYAFPTVEIIPSLDNVFFSTSAKYTGSTQEICPARFSYSERSEISNISKIVHKALGLSQYSRSDFILKDGRPYFLEVNTLPGLTKESLYPKAAEAVGLSLDQFVAHLVSTATR